RAVLDDLPGRLELDDARRKEQRRIGVFNRVSGAQAVRRDEVGVGPVDVNSVIDAVPILVDEDLAPAGLSDIAELCSLRRLRLGALEYDIDRRIAEESGPTVRVGL